ncbi:hypothetical protein ACOSP6_05725 [Tenacibaculum sp. MEBiC06402]|uniref:hypothetical protein n=1 Tax=unclassified Tenacibaculum TaxID=2635139 RepID=UPI003B9B4686
MLITKTIKLLLLIIISTFGLLNLQGQNCSNQKEISNLDELIRFLDQHRSNLKKVRDWSRKNERPKIELASNRLEYWSKDIKRYIIKYKKSHQVKVCERVYKKEAQYFRDFFFLAMMYKEAPNFAPINFSKYK